MLKFRVTNSTKARRAAEAQRRALEEKLEWAWKPMAAMMNEDKTDLVYWIPPLYSSNLMAPGVPRRQSLSRAYTQAAARQSQRSCAPPSPRQAGFSRPYAQLSPRQASFSRSYGAGSPRQASFSRAYAQASPRQGSFTRAYAQASPRQGSFSRSYAQAAASQRKKKLATRRTKMTMEDCCQDAKVNHMMMGGKEGDRMGKDEDNESGIHDASNEELGHHSLQVPEQHFRPPPELQRATFGHPKIRRTSSKLKRTEKESIVRRHSDSAVKSKTLPSVMKLLEKVSHFHTLPSAKKSGGKKFITRELESRCYGSKKVKRPSVKVYNTPTLSTRRAKAQNEEDPRFLLPDSANVGPEPDLSQQGMGKYLSGDSPKVRHAHLQMILRLLAQMYEEKVVNQDTQIQQLKNKVQAQEKHMKRMAHMLLHLKEEVTRMKNLRLQRDLQGNVLSIKVGQEGKTGIDV
ncbi:uncharacterized protein [Panulirus ornatus]|uniref:uncharacterized protein isoform X2 n=1 Tax=Panulirus ornatus TaxID=150431 RepID=UPI003A88C478